MRVADLPTVAEAFLGWLYEHDHEQPAPTRFLDDPRSTIGGHQVTETELIEAVELLGAQQLIVGMRSWGSRIPLRIRLTPAGRLRAAEPDTTARAGARAEEARPLVVFISYAWDPDDPSHGEVVRNLWTFLRSCGLDARLDLGAAQQRQDWALWMAGQIREADHVLVIASPAYRERAEGRSGPAEGRGVQWEARLIRDKFYADQHALDKFIPVVLPGQSEDGVPDFLAPATSTVYTISDFTVEGAEPLLRLLTNQPEIIQPPLGAVPVLAPRPVPVPPPAPQARERQHASGVRNEVIGDISGFVIQAGSVGPVTVPSTFPSPSFQVGEGVDPRTRRAFEEAFRRAGGADHLGRPTDKVFEEGPVFIQHFTGAGESDAVIGAIAGQAAVVVAGPVWDDLSALPGFPAQGMPTARTDANARVVELADGTWGEGVLFRSTDAQPARWQPKPRLSMEAREAFRLPVAEPADVTIRAIATLHWPLDDDLEITGLTRHHLEVLLPLTEFNALTQTVSIWRGEPNAPRQWVRASGPNAHQSGRHARYDQTFANPADGSAAVRAVARIMLPGVLSSAITVTVEFQVNFAAWQAALAAVIEGVGKPNLRLTAKQIVELWTAEWEAATLILPRALVPDPETAALLAPPTVELQIKLNDEVAGDPRGLLDMVGLSVFGEPNGQPGSQGAATMTAPIGLDRDQRRAWAAKALTRMARSWSFVDAEESALDRPIR